MDLYEILTEYVEIMELLDRIEARQFVVEASITTIDAMPLTEAQREAHLAALRGKHELLCAEIEAAIERVVRLERSNFVLDEPGSAGIFRGAVSPDSTVQARTVNKGEDL